MRRFLFLLVCVMLSVPLLSQGLGSVNIDAETTAAMVAAYATEYATEAMNDEHVQKILDHYTSAEVATAGIYASKWLDRKAMTHAGLFSSEENFYYKRIYRLVSVNIMPKLLTVAFLLIKYPDKALYWGPYLFRVCEQVKQLCMIFQVVVTNNKLSFQDVVFLTISDELKGLFDLTKFGEVDWKALWDKLSEFGDGITNEDIAEDLEGLKDAGSAVASAGSAVLEDLWREGSSVTKLFEMKTKDILKLYDDYSELYETLSDPAAIKELVMQKLVSTDSTGVARLFTADGYNITSYISDYLNELEGRYYTQQWYICLKNSGDEVVCLYSPSSEAEYYTVNKLSYTDADVEAALVNNESYAGWSRMLCRTMSHMPPVDGINYKYVFKNTLHTNKVRVPDLLGGGATHYWILWHDIEVHKTWDSEAVFHEEVFDSQYDDESVMQARFNALLQEYNENELHLVYTIGKGNKVYYDAPNEARLKGCSAVSFSMSCDDHAGLGEGSFSWKENGNQRHALDENSKRFAMETSLSGCPDTSELDAQIENQQISISNLESQIAGLKQENSSLLAQISNSSVEEAAPLREQYQQNLSLLSELNKMLSYYQGELSRYQQARQELLDDYADEEDESYRIPHVMHEIESAYHIVWQDAGSWNGWSFIRHGNIPDMNAVVVFQADLTRERKESHFLGIRTHRAILGIHWTLGADYSSNEIVDIVQLDQDMSEEAKADFINQRLHEIMQEHPGCRVEANYTYSSPPDASEDEDAVHLLWVCDRLAIARDVDYRLSKIYAQLVLIEKFMYSRETALDFLKRAVGLTGVSSSGRRRIGGKSYERWRRSASGVSVGTNLADQITDVLNDKELQKRY